MGKNRQRYESAIAVGKQSARIAKTNGDSIKDVKYYQVYCPGRLSQGWLFGWKKEFDAHATGMWKNLFKRFTGRRVST